MSEAGRRALIFGVSGQDGSYLARMLLEKGYRVTGTSRSAGAEALANLRHLGVHAALEVARVDPVDGPAVSEAIRSVAPDEIYFLAAQSSVGKSFEAPQETMDSIVGGTGNVLEGARRSTPSCRMYFASSGDCFGNTGDRAANEETDFNPASPYGVARCEAAQLVRLYRDNHGLYASNGFTFAHESPLRPAHFVTRKIALSAAKIASGLEQTLELGSLDVVRDWGWAPEYVDAMQRTVRQADPRDYVIATGRSIPLESLVDAAFRYFGLDWRKHVKTMPSLRRASDIRVSRADPSLAEKNLGWRATVTAEQAMQRMCEAAAAEAGS